MPWPAMVRQRMNGPLKVPRHVGHRFLIHYLQGGKSFTREDRMRRLISVSLAALIASLSANSFTFAGIMSGPAGLPVSVGPLKTLHGGYSGSGSLSRECPRENIRQQLRVPTRLIRTKIAPNSQRASVNMASASSSPSRIRRQIRSWPNRR